MNTLRRRFSGILSGQGLGAKAMRGSALTILGFGGGQFLRLVSNLVLTRLLFPEAFGMMALVYVFMQGLNNFSDVGVTPSIMQSKRGDDPEFLNTAWTIQVIRGMLLWGVTFVIAYPAAQFFDAPMLAQLLPVVGVTLAIAGFNPTRLDTANRHLNFGRLTVIDLASQVVSLIVAVVAAWILQSVWALVISGIVGALVQLIFLSVFLPGQRNRFRWEPAAANELINFGKWIFLSTVVGFFLSQGDKIILGKYLSLETLGIYNIGFFLASFPLLMGGTVTRRILIPIYRELPPKDSPENFRKLRKMRFALSGALMGIMFALALVASWLINTLYDPRYTLAGGILVMIACAQVPHLIALTYDQAALAAGDSRRFFVLALSRTILMLAGLVIGVKVFGLLGALIGQGFAMVLVYPVVVWLARHQGTWDPRHDAAFAILGAGLMSIALYVNWPAVQALVALNSP
ncbi:oligosaccharide flippase family protein [Cognatishimia sp. 1_MG-2023]|uniref:oligosaccharide flippase family protein n=1 Tax=Cognatishimia sp. 1_MG-2023 TaxID=3062642 RepID=UPI0026E249FB|nr:oligosaccharide flippase family protein [Cognatishimia sp. 1_MG-2023]MDO6725760.1 oligosaccharide flippase family protein [Cognatishimia sp. 1_MG-2023]